MVCIAGQLVRQTPIVVACLLVATSTSAQSTIRLYPGVAPGSEQWSLPEHVVPAETFNPQFKSAGGWTFNVSAPTLTVYRPDPDKSNGTAVIVCPGGAFHFLANDAEGEPIARWLRDRGVTAFVLKYRVAQTTSEHRIRLFSERGTAHVDSEVPAIAPLALADARAALRYVRAHAAELGIVPTRVGVLGGSAGAVLAVALVTSPSNEPKPDFIAPLYVVVFDFMRPLVVPKPAPPAFMALASDDPIARGTTDVYNAWIAARGSVELHAYAKGGHGFGMLRQGLPVDSWTARFEDWLRFQGLLTRPK